MIPIVYFRSSSYNCHRFCEMQYYGTYTLGIVGASNKKADKGTISHKILEICAICKKLTQDGFDEYNDSDIGMVYTHQYNEQYLVSIGRRVYDFYTSQLTHHTWETKDFDDCMNSVWKALRYNNGTFDPMNRNIVAPEAHFDIKIEKDWAKYSYEDYGVEGHLSIKGTVDLITDVGNGVYEVVDWKGLPIDTLIPTPNGWTTMGELQVGDLVFDKDGDQVKVLGKSKVKEKDCYKITFDDKTSVVCDDEHLWYMNNGEVRSVTELKVDQVIPVAKPVKYNKKRLPIDPYVLGLWLGDGRNKNGEISSCDVELYESIEKAGYLVGEDINKSGTCPSKTVYGLMTGLRKLNLLNNKHIPDIYLESSYNQRLKLLRGLMDSDGNVNTKRKQCVFTSCNKKLSDDVKTLLLSLGQRPNQGNITRDTNFKKDVKVYPIHFRPIDKINPFSLKRKKEKVDWTWGNGKSNIRRIISIEKIEKRQTQCIMVDSPSNTYLCTKNFIVTHNTGKRLDWATGKVKDQQGLFSDGQLRIYHYALKHLYPEVKAFIITIYFINDGGPYSVHFQDSDLAATEQMIQRRFEYIKKTDKPKLMRNTKPDQAWKCKKLCHLGQNTFENSHVEPIIEKRLKKPSKYNTPMTMCEQILYSIEKNGIDWTTKNYKHPNHVIGKYKKPGEVE